MSNEAIAVVPDAPAQTTALAAYEPKSMEDAWLMAERFAKSGITRYKTPEQVFLIMAAGAELKIPPTAALRCIYIVEGVSYFSADLKVALCLKSGVCEYFECVESNDQQAIYRTKRRGRPERTHKFTIGDAERAGLLRESRSGEKTNWQKRPAVMLRHRCSSELASMEYTDITLGLGTLEEMEEVHGDGAPTSAETPPKPLVLDAELVASPPANSAEQPSAAAEPVTSSAPPVEPERPSIETQIARWKDRLQKTSTEKELEAIRVEIRDDGPSAKGGRLSLPQWRELAVFFNTATKRLEEAKKQKQPEAAEQPPRERVPGEDDE